MRKLVRTTAVIVISMLALIASSTPVAASPGDPQSVDELRSSLAYRADHADVLRLYRAFFEREPDIGGALYWIGVYEDGATLDDLAWGFSNSTEFRNTYGDSLDNRSFLTIVYGNVLGREPDIGGLNYWMQVMEDGLSRDGVVRWVAGNEEFIIRYRYSDLSPDLAGALLRLEDMPAGWVEDTDVSRSVDDASCSRMFRFPDNAVLSYFFGDADYGPFATHALYSYVTVDRAESYMQKVRNRLAGCATSVDFEGWTTTRQLMSFTEFGDEMLAFRVVDTHTETGTVWISEYVLVRYGSSISGTYHQDWASVFTFRTEEWVSISTQRLVSLAEQ